MRSVPHRVVCLLGLDDGAFPRKSPRDGDDLMLERAPRRRARSAQRGSPAAARRAACGDRPPRHHLRRQRRAHQHRRDRRRSPSASCSTSSTPPFAPKAGARASRSWCAIRCSRLTPAISTPAHSSPIVTWSFDRTTLDGARALVGPRSQDGSFLPEPLPRARFKAGRARRPGAVRRAPGARVSAPATSNQPVRRRRTRSRTAWPSSSTGCSDGESVSGCSRRASPAPMGAPRSWPRSRAERCRRVMLGQPVINQVYPTVDAILTRGSRAASPADAGAGTGRRARRACRRPAAQRHRLGVRRPAAAEHVTRGWRPSIGSSSWVRFLAVTATHPERGFAAATVGRASGSATVTVARIAPFAGDARAPPLARARAPAGARSSCTSAGMREPLPLYCVTSAAYAQAARRARSRDRRRRGVDLALQVRRGGRRARAPARSRRRAHVRRAARRAARADERGQGWDCRETHALRPLRAAAVGRPARLRGGDDAVTECPSARVRRHRPAADRA